MERDIAVQTAVYRGLSVDELIAELERADIRTVELAECHLPPADDDESIDRTKRRLASAGVDVCGIGVLVFDDADRVRERLKLASAIGADYVSVNFSPTERDLSTALVNGADEFDIGVHIHNIAPAAESEEGKLFSSSAEIVDVLGSHPSLRCCVDTGHVIRQGESLKEAIAELSERIESVHLKGASTETREFSLDDREDLVSVIDLLDEFTAVEWIVLEHRSDTGETTRELGEVRRALSKITA